MKATDLLRQHHRMVEKLFEKIDYAKSEAKKAALFQELAATLVAHDAIEREIFYPACERAMGKDDDTLKESIVEHGVVEFSLLTAHRSKGKGAFETHVKVLKENIEHHVKEEENKLLPKAEREIGTAKLTELGAKMEARFQKAVAGDFLTPLQSNLKQVLTGKDKPKPAAKTRSVSARRTRTTRATTKPRATRAARAGSAAR